MTYILFVTELPNVILSARWFHLPSPTITTGWCHDDSDSNSTRHEWIDPFWYYSSSLPEQKPEAW
jgi:hypothetical protein